MKKAPALCLIAVALMIPLFSLAAGGTSQPIVTEEQQYDQIIQQPMDIVPTILIHDAGSIKVTISWQTPELTFIKRLRTSPEKSYFSLENQTEVAFTILNQSVKSSDNTFNGNLKVQKTYFWENDNLVDNIWISLLNLDTPTVIPYGTTNNSIKLQYKNSTSIEAGDKLLGAELSATDIINLLTTKVTFTISKAQ